MREHTIIVSSTSRAAVPNRGCRLLDNGLLPVAKAGVALLSNASKNSQTASSWPGERIGQVGLQQVIRTGCPLQHEPRRKPHSQRERRMIRIRVPGLMRRRATRCLPACISLGVRGRHQRSGHTSWRILPQPQQQHVCRCRSGSFMRLGVVIIWNFDFVEECGQTLLPPKRPSASAKAATSGP